MEPDLSFEATLESYTVSSGSGSKLRSYTTNIIDPDSRNDLSAASSSGGLSGKGSSMSLPQDASAAATAVAAAADVNGGAADVNVSLADSSGVAASTSTVDDFVAEEQLFDPNCDPNNPKPIQFQDVSAAAYKIRKGIVRTPCDRSHMSRITNMDIYLKKDFLQYTGSFKERGARYTLLCLDKEQRKVGVVAASAGNHALALAYHGQELGIPVAVVMPTMAPLMKIYACMQYGARVVVTGNDFNEAKIIAMRIAKTEGLLYVNGYDHPQILAGQGTIGLEIIEQMSKPVDAVVVPVGGGGLIAGIAVAMRRSTRVSGQRSHSDGRGVHRIGHASELEKVVVEGAGEPLQGLLPELQGKTVVVILCGGNIDTTVLGRVIERGLAVDGRLIHFVTTVSDRPGGIAELSAILAGMGVSIKDIFHERAWLSLISFRLKSGESLLIKSS
uniref:Serine racemase n=1 Tax=Macrostomum lignano TaxID=282301 RepID=A0A1I8GZG0_9PLAT